MAEYRYYNVSPNQVKRNDCVTRAICLASGLPYSIVRQKLYHTSKLLDCERVCMSCYQFLIHDVLGGIPVDCEGYTVNEFADKHPIGVYLVRMEAHISTIIDGVIYDIFDCRSHELTNAWRM